MASLLMSRRLSLFRITRDKLRFGVKEQAKANFVFTNKKSAGVKGTTNGE